MSDLGFEPTIQQQLEIADEYFTVLIPITLASQCCVITDFGLDLPYAAPSVDEGFDSGVKEWSLLQPSTPTFNRAVA